MNGPLDIAGVMGHSWLVELERIICASVKQPQNAMLLVSRFYFFIVFLFWLLPCCWVVSCTSCSCRPSSSCPTPTCCYVSFAGFATRHPSRFTLCTRWDSFAVCPRVWVQLGVGFCGRSAFVMGMSSFCSPMRVRWHFWSSGGLRDGTRISMMLSGHKKPRLPKTFLKIELSLLTRGLCIMGLLD